MLSRSVALGIALGGALWTVDARACRTSTCAVTPTSANCSVDPVTECMVGGNYLYWEQQCVSYSTDVRAVPSLGLDFGAVEQLVGASFSLWPTATCDGGGFPSIAVTSFGPLFCLSPEYNRTGPNANGVIFYESDWPHDPMELGLTAVTFDTETGKIFDADMEINVAGGGLDQVSLSYIVAHEAGHFLGLDHSADTLALMYKRYSPVGEIAAPVLGPDDIANICAAYPPSRPVGPCNFEPQRGYASDCGGNVEGSCRASPGRGRPSSLAGWLVVAGVLARRLRDRRSTPSANKSRSCRNSHNRRTRS